MSESRISHLKNVSKEDQKMIQDIETMMGPEPSQMGLIKNMFWGRFRDDLVFPYPEESDEQREKADRLLEELEAYLKLEHPAVEIDQEEYIPDWSIKRLFDMGVMGMTIPEEYGGLGLGVTAYNRVLEMIGRYCASTAVVVSAHQSIGCKAIMLFGTEEQKRKYLPMVAKETLSAFCLSEPNVGSDAAGQETYAELTDDGEYYVLNGEKKWSTSAAMAGLFTVMAKQLVIDPKTGEKKEGVTAVICTPDTEGFDVFEKNRSKTGIRGTWQGRIRFSNVRVPRENLLHQEGKGLVVALSCLNYGRCTLSAGVGGAAKRAMDQSVKWVQTRYQFGRPLADFELVQQKIARMAAYTYAMDAVLYMMTGMLDRGDSDIMIETAATKVFCSHYGWEVIDDAVQIMGGEGYMTENELERIWRDNRIHRIVEGSNEVMQSFIFAYGGKQLAESMIGIQEAMAWQPEDSFGDNVRRLLSNAGNATIMARALPLAAQLFFGVMPAPPEVNGVYPSLRPFADRLGSLIRKQSHYFKLVSKWHREKIIKRQAVQARLADNAVMLYALTASLSKMDMQIRKGISGPAFDRDKTAFRHLFDLFEVSIAENIEELRHNADESMRVASDAARRHNDTLPNSDFYIHEASPVAAGTGKKPPKEHIKQFPGSSASAGKKTGRNGASNGIREPKTETAG